VRLTIIGCSGSHPGPEAACSSYLLEQQGFRLLIDLGNGALGELQRHVDPRDVDAIFLTHLHADHWLDLVPLAHVRRHHPDGRLPPPVPVVAPIGERHRIAGAFGQPESMLEDVYDFQDPRDASFGPFEATIIRTRHPVETYALRLTAGGRSLAYTADTGPFAELSAFVAGVDLLLAEATFTDARAHPPDVHLSAAQAGELARAGRVGRLVVTHVAPWHDAQAQLEQARAAFGGRADLAKPGATFDV
jgi:ribonuclease BN (tRNA processing enzyme)